MYQGVVLKFFRWPYQAKVMKRLLASNNNTVCRGIGRALRVCIMACILNQNGLKAATSKRKQLDF